MPQLDRKQIRASQKAITRMLVDAIKERSRVGDFREQGLEVDVTTNLSDIMFQVSVRPTGGIREWFEVRVTHKI